MRKSCLVQLILLILMGVVLGLVIHHLTGPASERVAAKAVQDQPADPSSDRRLLEQLATLVLRAVRGPTPEPTDPQPTGIEGLQLETSRPLFVEDVAVRGLVVGAERLWLACERPDLGQALLYQLDRDSGTVLQARRLDTEGYGRIGGLITGDGLVWLALYGGESDSSLVLGLTPDSLETRIGLVLPARIQIVCPLGSRDTPDAFRLLTINESSDAIQVWDTQARPVSSHPLATGASYCDGMLDDGRLVCLGSDAQGGIIDVLDPETLSLLIRHRAHVPSDSDRLVAGGALGLYDQTLWFAHSAEPWPMLAVYRPAKNTINDWLIGSLP